MKKYILDLSVVDNRRLNHEYVVIDVTHSEKLPEMRPGQFVEVRVDGSPTTFLRRPISIHDYNPKTNVLSLLVQEIGDGTRKLAQIQQNDKLNIMFPLGNWFTLPHKNEKVLLIGGGCGIAPLLFLGRIINEMGGNVEYLLGARKADGILELDVYKQFGKVHITTEDGSMGTKGYVVHHPVLWDESSKFDRIYTCGPDAMMRVVAKYALKNDITCEASLENTMACGFGVCLCCVTQTTAGHKCVCTDGPVFNVKDLKEWQI
jgi:dihydroorotate dehydrogenase electron transfer subunit